VLNCNNLAESKLPSYDSTRDKYLRYFFIRTTRRGTGKRMHSRDHRELREIVSREERPVLPELRFKVTRPLSKQEFDTFLDRKRIELIDRTK
jgi:hypothetical protein